MVVNDELRQLLNLQEVDEFIAEARLKQKRLPEGVAAELLALQEAKSLLDTAEETLAGHEAEKRRGEAELADQEAHIKQLKGRLKEIANTREYQAHIQEMDGVQRAVSKLEDEVLQSLSDIDLISDEVATHRKLFTERETVYKSERAKVDAELAKLEKEVQSYLSSKEERAGRVSAPLLKRYDRISRTLRRAVVAVDGYTCSGCHMNVPPQVISEVKRGNGIHQCPHCHRLLYVPEPPPVDVTAGK